MQISLECKSDFPQEQLLITVLRGRDIREGGHGEGVSSPRLKKLLSGGDLHIKWCCLFIIYMHALQIIIFVTKSEINGF